MWGCEQVCVCEHACGGVSLRVGVRLMETEFLIVLDVI